MAHAIRENEAGPPVQQVPEDVVARIDQRVVLYDVPWERYEELAETRGESAVPRMTYLDGVLEIMSPSTYHEKIKTNIARLLEAYADERDLPLEGYGSWTVRNKKKRLGLEPDECYVLGGEGEPVRPDLAIEVNWTRGGIQKLDVYAGLGVPEVWMWDAGRIVVHVLRDGRYERADTSALIGGIDLELIASLLNRPQREAVRELRRRLRE